VTRGGRTASDDWHLKAGTARMFCERSGPSRRAVLMAAALLPLAGCGTEERPAPGSAPTGDRSASGSSPALSRRSTGFPDVSRFAALEREHGARLGVYALATGTGATVAYRADERFAFCSTFKTLAAAAVLHRNPLGHLAERVTFTRADVNSISPVTENHIGTGMTIGQLCDAAIRYSDGTAGNLLMRDIGGPARLTAYLRELGDTVSRMDTYEPELNRNRPQDPRDTTTPRAIAADYRELVLGDALTADKRALLRDWLERSTTAARRIRAGLPKGWTVADKTGTGDYGRANDIAIVWPPHTAPLVMAIMSDRSGYHSPPKESLIAEATRLIVAALT
jgi:beta-lactamase class A